MTKLRFLRDLQSFLREERKYWLGPIILLLLLLGLLLITAQNSVVAPFIYTLF